MLSISELAKDNAAAHANILKDGRYRHDNYLDLNMAM